MQEMLSKRCREEERNGLSERTEEKTGTAAAVLPEGNCSPDMEQAGAAGKITRYETFSEEETFRLGEKLARDAQPGRIFALNGDLGVGKTVFTKGMAAGLGIRENVNSPTFTIVQVYEGGRLPFYHFDVYRIGDIEEMEEIGYEDYFYGSGICLVEWAGLIRELLPEYTVWITIEKDPEKGFDYRRILVEQQ